MVCYLLREMLLFYLFVVVVVVIVLKENFGTFHLSRRVNARFSSEAFNPFYFSPIVLYACMYVFGGS